jgi:transposase
MATRYTEEFRRDAVRIATTIGLTRPQVSSDLGVGLSTLNKWIQRPQHDDLISSPQPKRRPRRVAQSLPA